MTKEIPLTQGQVALVDDDDYERVNQFKWCAAWDPKSKRYYAATKENYFDGLRRRQKNIQMSRFILNTPKGMECDHVNHNTLDNRKSNLRNCTKSENQRNALCKITSTSGFKGVHIHGNGYQAVVKIDRKTVFRKWFPTLEEAIEARREAAKKYHGEFYHE